MKLKCKNCWANHIPGKKEICGCECHMPKNDIGKSIHDMMGEHLKDIGVIPQSSAKDWDERFNVLFPAFDALDGYESDSVIRRLKSFITQEIKEAELRGEKLGRTSTRKNYLKGQNQKINKQ